MDGPGGELGIESERGVANVWGLSPVWGDMSRCLADVLGPRLHPL